MPFYLLCQLIDDMISQLESFAMVNEDSSDLTDNVKSLLDLTYVDEDNDSNDGQDKTKTLYTIVFSPNGGTGVMSDKSIYHGKAKSLSKNRYKRTGYDFLGWSTNKDATSIKYSDRAIITINDKSITRLVLYAIWKIKSFKITYNANGGTGSMAAIIKTYGTKYALDANAFKRTDYDFLGWSTNKSKTTADYKDKQQITVTSNLTLYAIWKIKTVTISFNANGGTGSMASKTVNIKSDFTIPANSFTRSNYEFEGWAISSGGGIAYANKATIKSVQSNITLYAKWKSGAVMPLASAKAWSACSKASCWNGNETKAKDRIMNILSPKMSDSRFNSLYSWSKGRQVNCFHLAISNNDDVGENDPNIGGYTIYGNKAKGSINTSYTNVMGSRIQKIFNDGYGVILWLMLDDDKKWNNDHYDNFDKYCRDIKSLGWFQYCSTVCLGLEMNESVGDSSSKIKFMVNTLKKYYGGKIGIHFGSDDHYDKANGTGVDIIFGQISPTKVTHDTIRDNISKGKKYASAFNMFEISRHDSRSMAQYALENGAYGVGNW